jgi:hypothetical protein
MSGVVFSQERLETEQENSYPWRSEEEKYSVELLKRVQTLKVDNIEVIENLIKLGAHVNYADEKGISVLMYAASHGVDAVDIMKVLINNGADVNAQDNKGQTPIMYAASNYISRYQSIKAVGYQILGLNRPDLGDLKLLLRAGADLRIEDNEGRNILQRINIGIVNPSSILSPKLGYKMVAFKSGREKVFNFLKTYFDSYEDNLESFNENLEEVSSLEAEDRKDQTIDFSLNQKTRLEIKEKELQRLAWAERDNLIRNMMTSFVFGEVKSNYSNTQLIDVFLEKVLEDLHFGSSRAFNFASSLLLNKDVFAFMERHGAGLVYSSEIYPVYNEMILAIKDYNKFITENKRFRNSPVLMKKGSEKFNTVTRSIRAYRGR